MSQNAAAASIQRYQRAARAIEEIEENLGLPSEAREQAEFSGKLSVWRERIAATRTEIEAAAAAMVEATGDEKLARGTDRKLATLDRLAAALA